MESNFPQSPVGSSPSEPPGKTLRWIALVFGLSLAYAVTRYHLFGEVAWSQLPLYTINKAVALTAIACLALALRSTFALRGQRARAAEISGKRREARTLGVVAAGLSLWHAVASATLVTPRLFPALFTGEGLLTFAAGASFALGGFSFVILAGLAARSGDGGHAPNGRTPWVVAAVVLAGSHSAFQGAQKWLQPLEWPGYLPPLTLLGSCIAVGGIAALIRGSRRSPELED